jgi:hypothetical protein
MWAASEMISVDTLHGKWNPIIKRKVELKRLLVQESTRMTR